MFYIYVSLWCVGLLQLISQIGQLKVSTQYTEQSEPLWCGWALYDLQLNLFLNRFSNASRWEYIVKMHRCSKVQL